MSASVDGGLCKRAPLAWLHGLVAIGQNFRGKTHRRGIGYVTISSFGFSWARGLGDPKAWMVRAGANIVPDFLSFLSLMLTPWASLCVISRSRVIIALFRSQLFERMSFGYGLMSGFGIPHDQARAARFSTPPCVHPRAMRFRQDSGDENINSSTGPSSGFVSQATSRRGISL